MSRLLLHSKANICARDFNGRTPLHVSVLYKSVDVARLLLEHGADVNAQDKGRKTPLLSAVKCVLYEPTLEVARLLVGHGANIDAEDIEGRTAFRVASESGYPDIAKFLSDHCSSKTRYERGRTARGNSSKQGLSRSKTGRSRESEVGKLTYLDGRSKHRRVASSRPFILRFCHLPRQQQLVVHTHFSL